MKAATTSDQQKVIDVHAHTHSAAAEAIVESEDGHAADRIRARRHIGEASARQNDNLMKGVWRHALVDPNARLEAMDEFGIAHQLVSVSPLQYYYWADPDLARRVVAVQNESIARLCDLGKGRISGLGAVALQHPELAVSQLVEGVRDYGLKGVIASTSICGRWLDQTVSEDFWECAERVGAVVFIHPPGFGWDDLLSDYYLSNLVGNPLETTIVLLRMIFGGVFDRHSALKLFAAHGGGFFPHYIGRFDHGFRNRPEVMTCKHLPSHYLNRIWYDCIVHDAQTLDNLIRRVGATRVVVGTDYPFDMGIQNPQELLDRLDLTAEEKSAVCGGNAVQLLSLGGMPQFASWSTDNQ